MKYIEVTFNIHPLQPFADILTANLADIGFDSFIEENNQLKAYVQEKDFSEEEVKNVITELEEVTIDYTIQHIQEQNWNAEWEKNFPSVEVGTFCRIRAPFHEQQGSFVHEILIEPKMSFGTGHHATTYLMIESMQHLGLGGKSVLDMGCGTGVLAILAEMEGAEQVLAIDIEEWAYENTKENIERNNCSRVRVEKGGAELIPIHSFDVVLANINRNILLRDLPVYVQSMKPAAKLLLSGFFESDVDVLKSKAKELHLQFKDQKKKDDWCLLIFEK